MNIEHEVVYAIEYDKKTIDSYNIVHNTNFEPKDITKIEPSEIPECDLLFYSPPCQAFSIAGRQDGFADPRGNLFFDAFKIIQTKKPKIAIMENVKGLTQRKFQFEFETMLQILEQEGYTNHWKVLNANDYGIPQNRERVFIVSIRNDTDAEFNFPQPFNGDSRLRDLLEDEVDEKFYISDEKVEKLLREGKYSTLNTMQGGNRQPKIVVSYSRKTGIGKELSVAYTLNSSDWRGINRNQNQNAIVEYAPYFRIRKLTPLECIRLMGFEDDDYYKLKINKVSDSQIYKMCGNSIVVNVIEKILQNLFIHIHSNLLN